MLAAGVSIVLQYMNSSMEQTDRANWTLKAARCENFEEILKGCQIILECCGRTDYLQSVYQLWALTSIMPCTSLKNSGGPTCRQKPTCMSPHRPLPWSCPPCWDQGGVIRTASSGLLWHPWWLSAQEHIAIWPPKSGFEWIGNMKTGNHGTMVYRQLGSCSFFFIHRWEQRIYWFFLKH